MSARISFRSWQLSAAPRPTGRSELAERPEALEDLNSWPMLLPRLRRDTMAVAAGRALRASGAHVTSSVG